LSKQGDSVALVRKHLWITQAAMGRLLGVHPQTVSDWERGGDSFYPTTGSATTPFAESQHAADTNSGEAEPDTTTIGSTAASDTPFRKFPLRASGD